MCIRDRKPERARFDSPEYIARYFMEEMRTLETEQTRVLYLDNRCRLIHCERIFSGSVAACVLHPREVLKKGLQYDASCFVLIHNHPSGDPTPSQACLLYTSCQYDLSEYEETGRRADCDTGT